jgi:transcriptional regulator with XRE-family HTH domain
VRERPLTSAQIRAARSLIRWTADQLAAACALSVATIRRAELKESATALTAANDLAIRRALEAAGVEFIDEDDGAGPGVRLSKAVAERVQRSAVESKPGIPLKAVRRKSTEPD